MADFNDFITSTGVGVPNEKQKKQPVKCTGPEICSPGLSISLVAAPLKESLKTILTEKC